MTQAVPDFVDEGSINWDDTQELPSLDVDSSPFFNGEPDNQDFLNDEPNPQPAETFDAVDPKFITAKRRPTGAPEYEKKIKGILKGAFDMTVGNTATVADAAAIYQYQGKIVEKGAILATVNPTFARGIDFLTEGTENPTIAFAAALLPLALQLVRNHEPILEPAPRGFKVPFTKKTFRIPIKVGIKLGRLRNATYEPRHMYNVVLGNPTVIATLEKQGVSIAPFSSAGRRTRQE